MKKLKTKIRKILFSVLYYSGIPFVIREIYQRKKVTILSFHDFSNESVDSIFSFYKKNYNVISLKSYVDFLNGSKHKLKELPNKCLILTVDDGLKNNFNFFEEALNRKMELTIFLTSGIIGTKKGFWWNHNQSNYSNEYLKRVKDIERLRILKENGFVENKSMNKRESLTFSEIALMSKIVDFQSHSITHPILPMCSDKKAHLEINKSKMDLEKILDSEIYAFAFPNGDYSKRDIDLVREAGYKCSLNTVPGYNTNKSDIFRLKRIAGGLGSDLHETIVKSSGLWFLLQKLFWKEYHQIHD